jgi:hypothetical protein
MIWVIVRLSLNLIFISDFEKYQISNFNLIQSDTFYIFVAQKSLITHTH